MSGFPFLLGALVAAASPPMDRFATEQLQLVQSRGVRMTTTAADLFRLTEHLIRLRRTEEAEKLLVLLSDDPNTNIRNEARFRRSKLLGERGEDRDAAILLRRILDEMPSAAPVRLQLAQLLDAMGDKDAALRELRAVQSIGLPLEVARLVDRYSEALRAARPSGASFEIAIAPDSNISRATRSATLGTVLGDFEIDEDNKARSGIGVALRGQAYRRFAIGGGEDAALVRLSGSADLYKKARFNDIALDLAAGPEFEIGRSRLSLQVGATQRWYGQKPFTRSVRIGAALTRPIGRRSQLRISGTAALVDNRLNDLQDGKSYSAHVAVEHALSSTTGLAASLGADRQSLKDPGYSTTGWRAGIFGWRELGRATLTAGAEIGGLRADERLNLFPEARSDRLARFTIGATFRQLTFGGFAPVARIVMERNRSTIEFYDYQRTRTELGIVRAF